MAYYSRKSDADMLFGIGMLMQPDADINIMIRMTIRMVNLRPFFNFEDSPIYLYYMA